MKKLLYILPVILLTVSCDLFKLDPGLHCLILDSFFFLCRLVIFIRLIDLCLFIVNVMFQQRT